MLFLSLVTLLQHFSLVVKSLGGALATVQEESCADSEVPHHQLDVGHGTWECRRVGATKGKLFVDFFLTKMSKASPLLMTMVHRTLLLLLLRRTIVPACLEVVGHLSPAVLQTWFQSMKGPFAGSGSCVLFSHYWSKA